MSRLGRNPFQDGTTGKPARPARSPFPPEEPGQAPGPKKSRERRDVKDHTSPVSTLLEFALVEAPARACLLGIKALGIGRSLDR